MGWLSRKDSSPAKKPETVKWNSNKNAFTLCPEQDTGQCNGGTMHVSRAYSGKPFCSEGGRHDWKDDEYGR